MLSQERLALRRKIMGALLRNAREQAGKSKKECAEALGCSTAFIGDLEQGKRDISLPQLEILAVLFRTPIEYFWSDGSSVLAVPKPRPAMAIPLRQRIIGTLLRKARMDAGKTIKECALFLGYSPARISAYEYGQRDIPFFELQSLAEFIGVPITYFLDKDYVSVGESATVSPSAPAALPVSRPGRDGAAVVPGSTVGDKQLQQFLNLPEDIREFVLTPTSVLYLRVAMKLSSLSAETLRGIAEGLLDITF
jgi:transcriptional regulator with XRE-family HTH domain